MEFDTKPKVGKSNATAAPEPAKTPGRRTLVEGSPGRSSAIPGKRTLAERAYPPGMAKPYATGAEGYSTGVAYIDRGTACDGKGPDVPGCLLEDRQRQRVVQDFLQLLGVAQNNYKLALQDLKIEELLKKEDDLNWVVSLVLDTIGAHFVNVAVKALVRLRSMQLSKLEGLALHAGVHGEYDAKSIDARAERALKRVTPRDLQTYVLTGFNVGKPHIKAAAKRQQDHAQDTKKQQALSYITRLQTKCDQHFQAYKAAVLSSSGDAELLVAWQGMNSDYHSVEIYENALHAKLDRYMNSGVPAIGRREQGNPAGNANGDPFILRDTRVIWLVDPDGSKSLWYQTQDSSAVLDIVHDSSPEFGNSRPDAPPALGDRVPDEFVDVAVERSEARWGPTPAVPNPAASMMRHMGFGQHGDPQKASPAKGGVTWQQILERTGQLPHASSTSGLPRIDLAPKKEP